MKNLVTPMRRVLFLVFILFALVTAFLFATRQRAASPAARQETPAAPLSGCTTPTFAAAANFGAGTSPQSVAAGDFNLDGKPDLATANVNSNNISVLLGNGASSFGAATNFPVGVQPFGIVVGDFNLDGKPDLVTANTNTANVSVLLGNGTGVFNAPTNFNAGTGPDYLAVSDFNLDGKPDLAVANLTNGQASILLGNGAGSFATPTTVSTGNSGDGPRAIVTGDFNRDGRPDVATANSGTNTASVLLGNGAGGLGTATRFNVQNQPFAITTGDFNLDGNSDLAVANNSSNSVSVLLGNGAGSFGAAANFTAGTQTQAVAVGDFNQDGKPDLVTVNALSNNVSVLLGNGAGSFGAATNISAGGGPRAVAVGDFNLDGRPDLATANFNADNASVLLNTCNGSPCGGTAFAAAMNITVGTNPLAVAAGDFNRDGKPDLVVSNALSNTESVLFGNGTGGFGGQQTFLVGTTPHGVTVGDFNGDGIQDLAVANANSNNVSLLLGNGAGGFGAATNFAVGTSPVPIVSTDFNRDGRLDVAVANRDTNNISVLLGNGAGSFSAMTNFAVGGQPQAMRAGDFNADGNPDFAVANATGNNVSVLFGNGTGSFGAATNFSVGSRPLGVNVGDFNADGKQDLAVANADSNNVSLLLGNGVGGFGAATNFPTGGTNPFFVAVGDFNADGKQDLALANQGSSNVSVLTGNGAGGFSAPANFGVSPTSRSIAVGDFNQDGNQDLAVANEFSNNVSILLNDCAPLTAGALQFNSPTYAISESGPTATITVTRVDPGGSSSVNYATSNGTATAGSDYTATNGTLNFAAGETSKSFTIPILNETAFEPDETINLTLSNPTGGTLGSPFTAVLTILNDDTNCTAAPANLVSWYSGEGNGNDIIGNNNGTLQNGATFAAGKVGQAFNFDGNDDRVLLGNPANLQLQTFTIETWIKRASATVVTNNPAPGSPSGTFFAYGQDGYGFGIKNNGALTLTLVGISEILSTATITDTNYHHVAVTKAGNSVIFHVDGVAGAPVTYNETFSFTTNAALGARGDGDLRNDFFGQVDELSIYNRALAPAEINSIFTASSNGKCRPSATLTGRVADSNNQPLAGNTVALSGAASGTAVTNSNGNYSFANVQASGAYTVTPVSAAYVFTPARADFVNLNSPQSNVNFTAQANAVPPATPPFKDDFPPRPNPDPTLWSLGILTQPAGSFDPNVTVSQQTGQLVITPVTNQTGPHFGGYVTVNNLDVSGGQVGVELVQAGTGGAQSSFALGTDFLNFSRFLMQSPLPNQPLIIEEVINGVKQAPFEGTMPMLMFQLVQNGQIFLNIAIPYDPVAHRFLRFRHLARDANNNPTNLLVFETSPDASTYTERARGDLGERSVSAITVELAGGTAGSAGNPGPIIFDNLATQVVNARFALAAVTVSEGAGSVTLNVTRTGLTNLAGAMEYSTQDGTATQRTRYVAASGVLPFAAGETSKSLTILLLDNTLVDGSQDFNVFLGPGQGLGVNGPGRVIVTITDNDTPPITTNPLETPAFFVTQQYYDFLSRQPDQAGLNFWVGQIVNPCGGNAACISQRRWNVSNAFFFEQEFQQTGSFVYRLYRAAYGNQQPFPNTSGDMDAHPFCTANPANCNLIRAAHVPNYAKFINDRARLDAAQLAATQLALANAFVNRAEFRLRYPVTQTAEQFVDALIANIQIASGANLTAQRDALIALHGTGGRGAVLYRLADDNAAGNPINNRAFIDAEYSRSFVLTQYFGYLRRDPDMPGLNFWLAIVNRFPLRSATGQNAMVCAFITSGEYQTRFSLITPRTDTECPTPP